MRCVAVGAAEVNIGDDDCIGGSGSPGCIAVVERIFIPKKFQQYVRGY